MKTKIVQYPNPALRTPTQDLDPIWLEANPKSYIKRHTTRLLYMNKLARGVGLAAQQIGIKDSMFIFCGKLAINPQITWKSEEMEIGLEGCLSIKEEALVPRHTSIVAYYLDASLNPVERKLEGFEARVYQHELDHLRGITILTYLPDEELSRLGIQRSDLAPIHKDQ